MRSLSEMQTTQEFLAEQDRIKGRLAEAVEVLWSRAQDRAEALASVTVREGDEPFDCRYKLGVARIWISEAGK